MGFFSGKNMSDESIKRWGNILIQLITMNKINKANLMDDLIGRSDIDYRSNFAVTSKWASAME